MNNKILPKIFNEKILNVVAINPILYRQTVEAEYISQNAYAGQFVSIKCCDGLDAILRRPISICDIDSSNKTFDIVFQIKGTGTNMLSKKYIGDRLNFIGPLGNPFYIDEKYKNVAIVGGGIGIFPLHLLAKNIRYANISTFLGFKNLENAFFIEEFKKISSNVYISTDDGSLGHKGVITDLFEKISNSIQFDIVYSCGPTPMLKNTIRISNKIGVPCQVSLEQRMGCGIGACLVCVCKTRHEASFEYSHVCSDGPVFWADKVILE